MPPPARACNGSGKRSRKQRIAHPRLRPRGCASSGTENLKLAAVPHRTAPHSTKRNAVPTPPTAQRSPAVLWRQAPRPGERRCATRVLPQPQPCCPPPHDTPASPREPPRPRIVSRHVTARPVARARNLGVWGALPATDRPGRTFPGAHRSCTAAIPVGRYRQLSEGVQRARTAHEHDVTDRSVQVFRRPHAAVCGAGLGQSASCQPRVPQARYGRAVGGRNEASGVVGVGLASRRQKVGPAGRQIARWL